jgi:hypothetical protein
VRWGSALTRDDGAEDRQPGLPGDVGEGVGELDVHQRQRLLHPLHAAGLLLQQGVALARDGAQGADVRRGRKAAASRP